jgi:CubicO group peptidase (beta-lactamase class C family)
MFRSLIAVTLLLGVTTPVLADALDDLMNAEMTRHQIPGLAVAVIHGKDEPVLRGYGKANLELSAPVTPETVFELGSVTKQFTATAIMMLVEQDKLHLDDKLTTILPNMPKAWDAITIRHLLTHTSGIKNTTAQREFGRLVRLDCTRDQVIDVVRDKPLDFAPGEKWSYSNTGFQLLGMVIEKVTGQHYGDFLQEKIFKPLGMTATLMNDRKAIIPHRAQGYSRRGNQLMVADYTSPSVPFAAGALVSTAADMAKWDRALCGEQLLKRSTFQQMWTPAKLNDGSETHYGFGWELVDRGGTKMARHGGMIQGFSSFIAHAQDGSLSVIVLTNCDQQNVSQIAGQIIMSYLSGRQLTTPATQ